MATNELAHEIGLNAPMLLLQHEYNTCYKCVTEVQLISECQVNESHVLV